MSYESGSNIDNNNEENGENDDDDLLLGGAKKSREELFFNSLNDNEDVSIFIYDSMNLNRIKSLIKNKDLTNRSGYLENMYMVFRMGLISLIKERFLI